MKATVKALLGKLPGKVTPRWPQGERFAVGLTHGTMVAEIYAPVGSDPQTPHKQDELYFIHSGSGTFRLGNERYSFEPGTCFFVPALSEHRFEQFTEDFATWAVFWGPEGGEQGEPGS